MNIVNNMVESYLNQDTFKFKLYIDGAIDFDKEVMKKFVEFCLNFLKIEEETNNLKVVFSTEKEKFETYAFYSPSDKLVAVYCPNRAILDVFRSLAHELVHYKQDIRNEITPEQSTEVNDGVPIENEANAVAGVIMRLFGRENKDLY